MAQKTREILKSYFETGDRPTEEQFVDLIDSMLNYEDDGDLSATFETLNALGDVGTGEDQLAIGNHDHEIGDMKLLFENNLI